MYDRSEHRGEQLAARPMEVFGSSLFAQSVLIELDSPQDKWLRIFLSR